MSETWGPRAHPERCNDEQEQLHKQLDSNFSRFMWTAILLCAFGGLVYVWWIGG